MKRYILNLLLLFSLGVTVNAQTTLFYDDFGSPEEAQVRRIWKYMPTGAYNTFIFAHPGAPNIGGKPFSEAKAIENNFYAVIAPKAIYSSVGLFTIEQDYGNPNDVYRIWSQLVAKGDVTPGHNGDGGALVINAGTTLSSLYVRFANLQTGKYYKLSYKIFIQNATVKLKHQILNSSGNSTLAESEKEWSSGTPDWYSVETWFHVPDDCPGGEYSVALTNANLNDSGNDFAIDELKFEEYESDPGGSTEIKDVKCDIIEPIARDDIKNLSCDDRGKTVVLEVLANDSYDSKPIDFSKFNFTFMVPIGWKYGEWEGLTAPNEGKWMLNRFSTPITVTFTPNEGFTGNPTPINYKLVSLDGSTGNSGVAQLIITYDCNPVTNNDTGKMTVGTPVTIDILENDKLFNGDTPKASDVTVTLKNPFNAVDTGTTITVEGEGTWTYSESDGKLTFTPYEGFTGVPTPITYTFKEKTSGETSTAATVTITVSKNYWHGTIDTDWAETGNWTANYVPLSGQDIEFATVANNGTTGDGNGLGPAINDLHLDQDRIIGDLINKSDKDLIVTTENQLIINEQVRSDNTGGIVVNADPNKASGTLIFKKPVYNSDVDATVQFYNKAYECDNCGFYRKQWQYFGVPVKSAEFPFDDVAGDETVNRWDETYNGDKWQPTTGALSAFVGYQITNDAKTEPTKVYNFEGKLNVGDASVALTKTTGVNYSGTNLVSNSYTAAIPISVDAMTFPSGVEGTVYLFNTGTRDQWRKLNGTSIPGYKSGQYLAVPLNLGGQDDFPDRIPSTHAFMLLAEESYVSGNLKINYSQLTKNSKVKLGDGATEIITRSAKGSNEVAGGEVTNTTQQLPSLTIDVIGEESADRVWIFQKEGTSHDFNNGWDGRKMLEDGIAQLYINAADESKLQVATVPELDSLSLGFIADIDGKYTFEFAQMGKLKEADIYLHDAVTGTTHQVGHGQSYSFTAKKGEATNRFSFSSKDNSAFLSSDESLLDVTASSDGKIKIVNSSSRTVSAFVYNIVGGFVKRVEVKANSETVLSDIAKGEHIVRLQNSNLNDVRRVTVE